MPLQYESIQQEIDAKVNRARSQGCWFRAKDSGKWETPEDFEVLVKTHAHFYGQSRVIIDQYEMADPKPYIFSRIKSLEANAAGLAEFAKKVFDYFNFQEKEFKSRWPEELS